MTLALDVQGQVGALTVTARLTAGLEPLVLVGPNGAGKTSLLLLTLGALRPTRGMVTLHGDVLCDTARGLALPIEARRIGYVPQDFALFPHLDVLGNVLFGVPRSHPDRPLRAVELLARFDLTALARRRVGTLSGGERQRVALARALAAEPRALLLDEPLASLDVEARHEVRAALGETLRSLGIPAVIVTHDAQDAAALGCALVVLEHGQVTQSGTFEALGAAPATPFVRSLVARRG